MLKENIWERLISDIPLRLKVALALGISEAGVIKGAKRRSGVFTKKAALNAICEHTGMEEQDILEQEKQQHESI